MLNGEIDCVLEPYTADINLFDAKSLAIMETYRPESTARWTTIPCIPIN